MTRKPSDDSPVTILTTRFWPDNYGGVERHMYETARAFDERGCSVRVICENRTGAPERETIGSRIEIRRLPRMDPGRAWRWMEWARVLWWRRAVLQWAPAGPIWASDPMAALGAILAGRRRDVIFNPAACTRGMRRVARAHPHVISMKVPRRLELIDRAAFLMARSVVVSSQNLLSQFESTFGVRERCHVVPHGVEVAERIDRAEARRRFDLAEDAFVVGFVGRLDPCKDVGFLFDAFAAADLPASARLLIVGEGPDRARLDSVAAERGLSSRITWTGKLSDPTPAFAAMDVKVLPSLYEAFGNVILEAMSSGVMVIGRRRDDSRRRPVLVANDELIEHGRTGLVVAPHDPRELGSELRRLSRSTQLVWAMGRQARLTCRDRTWDAVADAYLSLLGREPQASTRAARAA